MRNPDWIRDEVILAMDLYVRVGRRQIPAAHPDAVALSSLLNRLPIHDSASRAATFRNPAGISMILGNFLGIDPERSTPGLSRNNRLQEEVWEDFAADHDALRRTAEAIARVVEDVDQADPRFFGWEVDDVFVEGELLTRMHRLRERSTEAVRRKKERVRSETGGLACEACGFDFGVVYGPLGEGFAECHHKTPLAELADMGATRLADLAIVCANCHRMLHRPRRSMTLDALRLVIQRPR